MSALPTEDEMGERLGGLLHGLPVGGDYGMAADVIYADALYRAAHMLSVLASGAPEYALPFQAAAIEFERLSKEMYTRRGGDVGG